MIAGNEPRNNQMRVFGRYIMESTSASVKKLIFAEVRNSDRRTGFVLALDTIDELAVIGGRMNKLFNTRIIVFAGRVIVGK
jgi:hypothetical protein